MSDEEIPEMICAPAFDGDEEVIEGSIVCACSVCSTPIWLSPSGQGTKAVLLCASCGTHRMVDKLIGGEKIEVGQLTREQAMELFDAGGPELLKQAMEMISAMNLDNPHPEEGRCSRIGQHALDSMVLHPEFTTDVRVIILIHDEGSGTVVTGGYESQNSPEMLEDFMNFLARAAEDAGWPLTIVNRAKQNFEEN